MNEHIYCRDQETDVFYRVIGLSSKEDLIVYPKYYPNSAGNRTWKHQTYTGLRFPTESVRFIHSTSRWISNNVTLAYNTTFNCFVPTARKNRLELFCSHDRLQPRLHNNHRLADLTKRLLTIFIANSNGLSDEDFGIDASMLVGMDNESSDIDLVIYSPQKAIEAHWVFQKLVRDKLVLDPIDDVEFFVKRRQPYSPLMTPQEILKWEQAKISGLFKGVKFSVMFKDLQQTDHDSYVDTNQYLAMRYRLKCDQVVCDPGYINTDNIDGLEIVFGPRDIKIDKIITHLPERMGVYLREGLLLFTLGKLYKIEGRNSYAITQFVWDDEFDYFKKRYVTKIEERCFDKLVGDLVISGVAKVD